MNVPIDDTISIILNSVYRHPNIPPPNLPKETLKKLLEICTKESHFKHIDGTIYKQKDGVAMGSPLGCISANYYMLILKKMSRLQLLINQFYLPDTSMI